MNHSPPNTIAAAIKHPTTAPATAPPLTPPLWFEPGRGIQVITSHWSHVLHRVNNPKNEIWADIPERPLTRLVGLAVADRVRTIDAGAFRKRVVQRGGFHRRERLEDRKERQRRPAAVERGGGGEYKTDFERHSSVRVENCTIKAGWQQTYNAGKSNWSRRIT
ncbi:hypothetical protein RhiLY_04446 [Ceratobasidium sp. AG-Ba]|nr:hypothetical protein RhiLY_04446 [Ceratobasidium sp. AG-Ba]